MRLKEVFELRNGYTPSKNVPEFWEGGSIPWFRMEDIRKNGRILSDSIQHITPEAVKIAGLFEADSFIIATTATIGEHAWLIADSLANQQFTNLKVRKSLANKVSLKYLFFLLFYVDEECQKNTRITTFPAVNMNDFKNIDLHLPPLAEQEAIAEYLDAECGRIGRRIELLERKAEAYSRLRRSLINQAVTRVCPDSKLFRLKDIFEMRNGYTPSKATSEFWENGTIPWFRMEDIRKNGRILTDSIQHITPKAIKSGGLFEANSFILATTATIGEHAWLIADSLANQQFTNLKIRKSLTNSIMLKYMFYKFFEIDDYCKRSCRVTTFAAVDMTDLSNMQIYLPPIVEQREIAAYLDEKCGKIDAIIEKIATQVERLKELKRSLINEVVTGKRAIITNKPC